MKISYEHKMKLQTEKQYASQKFGGFDTRTKEEIFGYQTKQSDWGTPEEILENVA